MRSREQKVLLFTPSDITCCLTSSYYLCFSPLLHHYFPYLYSCNPTSNAFQRLILYILPDILNHIVVILSHYALFNPSCFLFLLLSCSPPTNFVTSFTIMQRWKWSEIRMPQSSFCIIVYREEERMLPGPRYTLFNNLFFSPLLSISLVHALPPQPTIGLRGVNEQTSWSLRRTP